MGKMLQVGNLCTVNRSVYSLATRKYVKYVTKDKLDKVNPKNVNLINKYFSFKNMNLSEDSKKSYMSDFNQFIVYIMEFHDNQDIMDILDVSKDEDAVDNMVDLLEQYMMFCTSKLGNNERRVQRRMSSISSLFLYLRKKRKIKENPIEYLERPKAGVGEKTQIKQTYLTENQVNEIRDKLQELGNLQMEVYFEIALTTMVRVKALNSIRMDQISFDEGIIKDVREKEGYDVTLYPSKRGLELLTKWVEYRKEHDIVCEYLFITKRDGRWEQITKGTMQTNWVKKIGTLIDLPELHNHDFRHSYATILYNNGMPLEEVSSLLNHKSTDVTLSHYIKQDEGKLKDNKAKFEI